VNESEPLVQCCAALAAGLQIRGLLSRTAKKRNPEARLALSLRASAGGCRCEASCYAPGLGDAETVTNTKVAGATPKWKWAGSDATVFSY
jgi:hypothetical protein